MKHFLYSCSENDLWKLKLIIQEIRQKHTQIISESHQSMNNNKDDMLFFFFTFLSVNLVQHEIYNSGALSDYNKSTRL